MRQRLPKLLLLAGVALMAIGLIATVTMLVVHDGCQHDQIGHPGDPTVIAVCSSYQDGADWGYVILGTGAATIVAGALIGSRDVDPAFRARASTEPSRIVVPL